MGLRFLDGHDELTSVSSRCGVMLGHRKSGKALHSIAFERELGRRAVVNDDAHSLEPRSRGNVPLVVFDSHTLYVWQECLQILGDSLRDPIEDGLLKQSDALERGLILSVVA